MAWLPIRYRGFYDVPRLLIVERDGAAYLFDCPFDDAADDYAEQYSVYRLPPDVGREAADSPWAALARGGTLVGTVRVAQVLFDETKRNFIEDAVFDGIRLEHEH